MRIFKLYLIAVGGHGPSGSSRTVATGVVLKVPVPVLGPGKPVGVVDSVRGATYQLLTVLERCSADVLGAICAGVACKDAAARIAQGHREHRAGAKCLRGRVKTPHLGLELAGILRRLGRAGDANIELAVAEAQGSRHGVRGNRAGVGDRHRRCCQGRDRPVGRGRINGKLIESLVSQIDDV